MPPLDVTNDTDLITVQVPTQPQVIQIQVPGLRGPAGLTGSPGPASSLTIGTVTTGSAGSAASAAITGTAPNQTLNLTIPRGDTGANGTTPVISGTSSTSFTIGTGSKAFTTQAGMALSVGQYVRVASAANSTNYMAGAVTAYAGTTLTINVVETGGSGTFTDWQISLTGLKGGTGNNGAAATITVGTVTTGAPGSSATVTNAGTTSAATFNFTIPRGDVGLTGPANTLAIGTVTTGAAGSAASATITGTAPNQTLNLTIPEGDQGPIGAGAPDATNAAKGSIQLAGDLGGTAAAPTVPGLANKANSTITISAGTGLTGGGDLSANRTLTVAYGSAAGTAVQGNDTRVTADQAAGTASIRTIGTGALQAAAGNHTHTATGISDSTAVGRSVLTAVDAAAARTAIGAGTSNLVIGTTSATAKAGDYQPTAANISDSTVIGRTVLTSVDAAAVRTAIGAGTSSLAIGTTSATAKAGDYAPPADGAAGVATMRTLGTGATQAAAGNDARLSDARTPTAHTHPATGISDSTATGRSLMTAVDAAAARTTLSTPLGTGVTEVRVLTQAAYDAIGTKSTTTLYVIQG